MRRSAWILVLSALLLAVQVSAKTADGKTPSVETVCDNEQGAAFGICNAYCEAIDCSDPNQRASNVACKNLKDHFEKLTGRPLPCEMTCPCPEMVKLFADITAGTVKVDQCIDYGFLLFVSTTTGDFVGVDNGPPAFCNANGGPPALTLTETERLVCRAALRRAAESQGVICRPPE